MPQMGESIAEGTLVRWIKKIGDTVDRDEPLFEISTDKVDAEIPSPAAGVLTAIIVKEGETVGVNSVVALIGDPGEKAEIPTASSSAHAAAPSAPPASQSAAAFETHDPTVRTSPLVRRIAREHSIDVSHVTGSGLGGRVTKDDILRHMEGQPSAPASQPRAPGDRVEPMSPIRRKIADHMVLSRRTAAHVHTVFHVDFSTVEAIRVRKKADYERAGTRVTYLGFIAKAVLDAIRQHPIINSSLEGDSIVYRKDVNLGIAVSLENGLIVPVIKQADRMNLLTLSKAIADVATRARSKQLDPNEVVGGTFTVTNPGQGGAQFGLPIINQPQVAILGVGTIEKRPVVVDDAVAVRTMAYLTLGFDHRVIDGAVADEFMAAVKGGIEHFDPKDA